MSQVITLAKRELLSFFYAPIAYVVLGLFGLSATLMFLYTFQTGAPAELRGAFFALTFIMIFLVPAISMRLISEELRSGTIEPLMTAPISDAQVILGKWIGAMGFYAVMLSPLLVLVGVLELVADPDYGPIFTGLLGLLLVGGLYLAIGLFASTITQHQIMAWLLTVFIISLFTIVVFLLTQTELVSEQVREALFYVNVMAHYEDFSKGLIDTSNFVFFLTGTALFLFLATQWLESRRWR